MADIAPSIQRSKLPEHAPPAGQSSQLNGHSLAWSSHPQVIASHCHLLKLQEQRKEQGQLRSLTPCSSTYPTSHLLDTEPLSPVLC